MKRTLIVIGAVVCVLTGLAYFSRYRLYQWFFAPRQTSSSASTQPLTSAQTVEGQPATTIIAENLKIPWEIVFLPDNSLLVTERPGSLLRIVGDSRTPITVSGVHHVGEGGLMGLALHPDFTSNHFIYMYLTTKTGDSLTNRVERYVFDEDTNSLSDQLVIIDDIPGANNHDGGRIAFGPDKLLYITTGDAQQEQLAQDTNSLAGKILRVTDNGKVPADNPFGNAVYSYGHRNPQGLAWNTQGRLWATEHGPSGTRTGYDEVNLIEKGVNYGWPTIQGDAQQEGMRSPIIQSGGDDTWAPAGMTIVDSTLYFVGLRGQALYSTTIHDQTLQNFTTHQSQEFGRLRVVQMGPDGWLYLATSNTDGRGASNPGDDKLIKVNPAIVK